MKGTGSAFLVAGAHEIALNPPAIMGILNVAPDSFYDGARYSNESFWLRQTGKMLEEGAAIIDIGAVSTRPGAKSVPETEEMERLRKPLSLLVKHFPGTVFSVDTYRAAVAGFAISEGAAMINDISGGTFDDKMFDVIAGSNVAYVLMHTPDRPQTMQTNPSYPDVVAAVANFFRERLMLAKKAGISPANIILDPGFGFGKTLQNNYELLHAIAVFKQTGCPILAGISRKSMINRMLHIEPKDALNGTTVLNTLALLNGADMLRVHDVKEAVQAVSLVHYYHSIV